MKIVHKIGEDFIEGENSANFLLSNNFGGFAFMNFWRNKSRYQGVFFRNEGRLFKVLESFRFKEEPKEIVNNFFSVERKFSNFNDVFFMPSNENCFFYSTDNEHGSEIFLDFKEAYGDEVAKYKIEFNKEQITIEINYNGEIFYLCAFFKGGFFHEEKSEVDYYDYDEARKSYPYHRGVFSFGRISGEAVFYFSNNKEEALQKSKSIFKKKYSLLNEKLQRFDKLCSNLENCSEEVKFAYNSCKNSLDCMSDKEGLYAGFPWFFQFWSRDELISLKALSGIDKELSDEILRKWSDKINGWVLPSQMKLSGEFIGDSIDAVGWLVKRASNSSIFLELEKMQFFLKGLDGEIKKNLPGQSWMDSISRKGECIEIQAMKLYMLGVCYKVIGDKKYLILLEKLKKEIKDKFWNGEFLFDNLKDKKIRPNVFIAYYFYPELLSNKEWEKCFKNCIDELWCDWGGFSSLSKKDAEFLAYHSGENGRSYHNGDSWFWINNLAGICLFDVNEKTFSEQIKKIIAASSSDILFNGAIGHHSEVSSANEYKPFGCFCQAFSSAMFIELIDYLKDRNYFRKKIGY